MAVDEDGTEAQAMPVNGDNVTSMSGKVSINYAYDAKKKIKNLELSRVTLTDFGSFGSGLANALNSMLTANSLNGSFVYSDGAITFSNTQNNS